MISFLWVFWEYICIGVLRRAYSNIVSICEKCFPCLSSFIEENMLYKTIHSTLSMETISMIDFRCQASVGNLDHIIVQSIIHKDLGVPAPNFDKYWN